MKLISDVNYGCLRRPIPYDKPTGQISNGVQKLERVVVASLFLIVTISLTALAGSKIEGDNAVVVDSAYPMPEGMMKLSTKIEHEADPGFYRFTPSFTLAYGVLEQLEIGLSPEIYKAIWGEDVHTGKKKVSTTGNHGNVSSFGDIRLYGKYHFFEEADFVPALTAKYTLKAPTTTDHKGLSTGEFDHQIVFLASKLFDRIELDFNLAYTYIGEPEDKVYSNEIGGAFACQYAFTERFIGTVELTGKTDYKREHFTSKESIFDGYLGARYKAAEDFEIRTALGTRLSETEPDYLGIFNLRWYFL